MNELFESDAFCVGVSVGIGMYQRKIIEAHKMGKPLKIGDDLYYLQSGRERLEKLLDDICK